MQRGTAAPKPGQMPLRIALLAALALLGGACSSPTAPTAITIAPAISVLKVGQGETLRVVAAADASRELLATWTSDNPAVATVDARGTVTAVATGAATIRATSHGQVATRTLTVVPNYAGNWNGQFKIVTCTRISGPGTDPCRFIVGGSAPLELQLVQTGRDVSGTLRLSNLETFNAGAVTGAVREDRTLVLQGLLQLPGFDSEIRLVSWTSSIQPPGNLMEGIFTDESRGANIFGVQVIRAENRLVNVTRR